MSRPQRTMEAARLVRVDVVQPSRNVLVAVLSDVLSDRGGIELASRQAKAFGQRICRFENFIR